MGPKEGRFSRMSRDDSSCSFEVNNRKLSLTYGRWAIAEFDWGMWHSLESPFVKNLNKFCVWSAFLKYIYIYVNEKDFIYQFPIHGCPLVSVHNVLKNVNWL